MGFYDNHWAYPILYVIEIAPLPTQLLTKMGVAHTTGPNLTQILFQGKISTIDLVSLRTFMTKQLVHKGKTNEEWKKAFKIYEDKERFVTVAQLRELLPKFGFEQCWGWFKMRIFWGFQTRSLKKHIKWTWRWKALNKLIMKGWLIGLHQNDFRVLVFANTIWITYYV